MQITGGVSLAIQRNKIRGKKMTASTQIDEEERGNIAKLDEDYFIFRTRYNDSAYLDAKNKNVIAMVRQLGIPMLFSCYCQQTQTVPIC